METSVKKNNRYCVIMCGGVGSRFWPVSRTHLPKQFLDLFGTGRSLLQMTVDRILPICNIENIILVTNRAYRETVREQLPDIDPGNILPEPARRNTAPCVCWAARHIYARNPEASIVTLPSDHLILRETAFHEALRNGLSFVEQGDRLLTIGIRPTSPHTGYGYIQLGEMFDEEHNIRHVKSFTEKPNLEMATLFMNSGEFYWNSGMFLWRADSVLKAFAEYAPEIANIFEAGAGYYNTPQEQDFIEKAFPTSPNISVDYAIMEKARNVYVETADLGWSDLGSWKALYEHSPKSHAGNVTQGCKVLAGDCRNSIFATGGDKIIVAGGLDGYIVADTENALLVYPISDEQKIRQLVNEVKDRFGDKFI